jgi:hypothetical protein
MRGLVFWSIFALLALNIALWGGLSLLAPRDKIEGMPYLAIFAFDLHIAAYFGWLYLKIRKQTAMEKA